jgi:PAS domain S-box-containing protein
MPPGHTPISSHGELSFLTEGGELGQLMRAHDWAATPLGRPESWPQSLKSMVGACLHSPVLGTVLWGPELLMLYNDAYIPSLADRHPAALGKPVAEVWDDTWEQVAAPFHEAMKTGRGFEKKRVELTMVRRGKHETTWWDITATPIWGEEGTVVGLLNQGTEITTEVLSDKAKLQADEDLRSLNASLEGRIAERTAALLLHENIVHSHRSAICAFDLDGRILAFNPAQSREFFRMFGHEVQKGDVLPDLMPPDQGTVIRNLMARALSGESLTIAGEFGIAELAKPSWEVSYYPMRDAEGVIIGAFHHATDISDRLREQTELLSAQDALRQAQKMESVGQLTGGLAHDFNNLLAGITGSLELIKRRAAGGHYEDIARYVGVGMGAAQRAASLTHRLLAFSRQQTLEPKVLATNRLITEMEDLIQRTIGPQIELAVVRGDALWMVKADASQLENALLNLCINARDAMPDGGKVTIETANRTIDDLYAKELGIDSGEYVSMCVLDNGVGMAPETAARAFEPFFTTKPIGLGTGLGLSMIYGFAKQSGGHARIHSAAGDGSMVCVYLPRYIGPEAETTPAPPPVGAPAKGLGQVVLLVDDEISIRLLVGEILTELGYTVLEAGDGATALRLLQSSMQIDLLVSDVGLPGGMNGRQLADAARITRPALKTLFITGYAENAVMKHGHLEPGMHVMTKPFELNVFASRVKQLLDAPN